MATELVAQLNGTQIAQATKQPQLNNETLQALVIHGDLSKLQPAQKVEYYRTFCARVGLDPATQPFKLLALNGKQILYCDRGGTAQLNKLHSVSHKIVERRRDEDIYFVIVNASTPDGRQTESIGAVDVTGKKGENLANAMMKAETKGKRRSTLDLLGLGMLDESEVESIPGAKETSLQPPIELSEEEKKLRSTVRKHRGNLNKSLQAATTIAEYEAKCKHFTDFMKMGEDIWQKTTFHNETETFASLAEEHRDRIERDLSMAGPAGIELWIKSVKNCGSAAELLGFVKSFREGGRFGTNDCEDALQEQARYLGMDSYTDCEPQDDTEDDGTMPEKGR